MSERRRVLLVAALAAGLAAAVAAPVVLAPRERLFGDEIVGRHHDPFTSMERFAHPRFDGSLQPLTDGAGALLSAIAGPVVAFNVLIFVSFPLSAAAAFALTRYLGVGVRGSTLAALAYAFSPFHVAHAAYHVHIAQTQWLPLYLLAALRWIDGRGGAAAAALSAMCVSLSSWYGALIAAAITPTLIVVRVRANHGIRRSMPVWLVVTACAVVGVAVWVRSHLALFAAPAADAVRYGARWSDYLALPADNPLVAPHAIASVEQQVSVGLAVLALAAVGVRAWHLYRRRGEALPTVMVLSVAATAFVFSLPGEPLVEGLHLTTPAAWLHAALPMFRSFARFGVVVQLMAAIAAGAGFEHLRRHARPAARAIGTTLLVLCAIEYSHWPLSRDVLPSQADRWLIGLPAQFRAVECGKADPARASVGWLSSGRISPADPANLDCAEPGAAAKFASLGFTHMIVPRGTWERLWLAAHPSRDWQLVRRFRDGDLVAVTANPASVFTRHLAGFWPREHDERLTWRWAAGQSIWSIERQPSWRADAVLEVELAAYERTRLVDVLLDGRPLTTLTVSPERRAFRIGPVAVASSGSDLVFRAREGVRNTALVGTAETRALVIAVGQWRWLPALGPS